MGKLVAFARTPQGILTEDLACNVGYNQTVPSCTRASFLQRKEAHKVARRNQADHSAQNTDKN